MRTQGWVSVITAATAFFALSGFNDFARQSQLTVVYAQSPCSNPPTKSNAEGTLHWPPGSTVNIYVDPSSFSASEIQDIKAAALAWQTNGGFGQVNFVATDPGPAAGGNNVRISEGISGFLASTSINSTAPTGSETNVISGADISFDHRFNNPDGSRAYSPGTINGGDQFLTVVIEHELGHVLGADDFRDASGNVTDAPSASVMGAYRGTNNQGYPPTNTTVAAPPGNASPITPCDRDTIVASEQTPALTRRIPGGGAGGRGPLLYDLPPDTGGGGSGGASWNAQSIYVVYSFIYY